MTIVKARSSLSVREAHKHQEEIEDISGEETTLLMSDKIRKGKEWGDTHLLITRSPDDKAQAVKARLRGIGWELE